MSDHVRIAARRKLHFANLASYERPVLVDGDQLVDSKVRPFWSTNQANRGPDRHCDLCTRSAPRADHHYGRDQLDPILQRIPRNRVSFFKPAPTSSEHWY